MNDLTGLGAPLAKLVETVSAGVGALYAPLQVRRMARASADEMLIRAHGVIAAEGLEARARLRTLGTEVRRQSNIESIVESASHILPESVAATPVSHDWVARFIQDCQDIGDREMQLLWSRILAGEVARPGSFSTRTLGVVRDLSRENATAFTTLCSFAWRDEDNNPVLVAPARVGHEQLQLRIKYVDLVNLTALGLISYDALDEIRIYPDDEKDSITLRYECGLVARLRADQSKGIECGPAILTAVGAELHSIAGARADVSYRDMMIEYWTAIGVMMTS